MLFIWYYLDNGSIVCMKGTNYATLVLLNCNTKVITDQCLYCFLRIVFLSQ